MSQNQEKTTDLPLSPQLHSMEDFRKHNIAAVEYSALEHSENETLNLTQTVGSLDDSDVQGNVEASVDLKGISGVSNDNMDVRDIISMSPIDDSSAVIETTNSYGNNENILFTRRNIVQNNERNASGFCEYFSEDSMYSSGLCETEALITPSFKLNELEMHCEMLDTEGNYVERDGTSATEQVNTHNNSDIFSVVREEGEAQEETNPYVTHTTVDQEHNGTFSSIHEFPSWTRCNFAVQREFQVHAELQGIEPVEGNTVAENFYIGYDMNFDLLNELRNSNDNANNNDNNNYAANNNGNTDNNNNNMISVSNNSNNNSNDVNNTTDNDSMSNEELVQRINYENGVHVIDSPDVNVVYFRNNPQPMEILYDNNATPFLNMHMDFSRDVPHNAYHINDEKGHTDSVTIDSLNFAQTRQHNCNEWQSNVRERVHNSSPDIHLYSNIDIALESGDRDMHQHVRENEENRLNHYRNLNAGSNLFPGQTANANVDLNYISYAGVNAFSNENISVNVNTPSLPFPLHSPLTVEGTQENETQSIYIGAEPSELMNDIRMEQTALHVAAEAHANVPQQMHTANLGPLSTSISSLQLVRRRRSIRGYEPFVNGDATYALDILPYRDIAEEDLFLPPYSHSISDFTNVSDDLSSAPRYSTGDDDISGSLFEENELVNTVPAERRQNVTIIFRNPYSGPRSVIFFCGKPCPELYCVVIRMGPTFNVNDFNSIRHRANTIASQELSFLHIVEFEGEQYFIYCLLVFQEVIVSYPNGSTMIRGCVPWRVHTLAAFDNEARTEYNMFGWLYDESCTCVETRVAPSQRDGEDWAVQQFATGMVRQLSFNGITFTMDFLTFRDLIVPPDNVEVNTSENSDNINANGIYFVDFWQQENVAFNLNTEGNEHQEPVYHSWAVSRNSEYEEASEAVGSVRSGAETIREGEVDDAYIGEAETNIGNEPDEIDGTEIRDEPFGGENEREETGTIQRLTGGERETEFDGGNDIGETDIASNSESNETDETDTGGSSAVISTEGREDRNADEIYDNHETTYFYENREEVSDELIEREGTEGNEAEDSGERKGGDESNEKEERKEGDKSEDNGERKGGDDLKGKGEEHESDEGNEANEKGCNDERKDKRGTEVSGEFGGESKNNLQESDNSGETGKMQRTNGKDDNSDSDDEKKNKRDKKDIEDTKSDGGDSSNDDETKKLKLLEEMKKEFERDEEEANKLDEQMDFLDYLNDVFSAGGGSKEETKELDRKEINAKEKMLKGETEADKEIERILENRNNTAVDIFNLKGSIVIEEVKMKFKKLSILIHPDKCKNEKAGEAFNILKMAYEQLLKDDFREEYKQFYDIALKNVRKQMKKNNKGDIGKKKESEESYLSKYLNQPSMRNETEEEHKLAVAECRRLMNELKERREYAEKCKMANLQHIQETEEEKAQEEKWKEEELKMWNATKDQRISSWIQQKEKKNTEVKEFHLFKSVGSKKEMRAQQEDLIKGTQEKEQNNKIINVEQQNSKKSKKFHVEENETHRNNITEETKKRKL